MAQTCVCRCCICFYVTVPIEWRAYQTLVSMQSPTSHRPNARTHTHARTDYLISCFVCGAFHRARTAQAHAVHINHMCALLWARTPHCISCIQRGELSMKLARSVGDGENIDLHLLWWCTIRILVHTHTLTRAGTCIADAASCSRRT